MFLPVAINHFSLQSQGQLLLWKMKHVVVWGSPVKSLFSSSMLAQKAQTPIVYPVTWSYLRELVSLHIVSIELRSWHWNWYQYNDKAWGKVICLVSDRIFLLSKIAWIDIWFSKYSLILTVCMCVLFYQPCTESDEDNAIQLEVKVHQVAESMEKMRRP